MGQIYRRVALQNGVNPNLAVDGSVTPVKFDLSFLQFQSFDIRGIQIYIETNGRFRSLSDFMSGPPLPNGFQLTVNSINEDFLSNTFRTNRDLNLIFPSEFNQVLGNTVNFNSTASGFGKSLFLIGGTASVEVTIQDDLTNLDFFLILVEGTIIE